MTKEEKRLLLIKFIKWHRDRFRNSDMRYPMRGDADEYLDTIPDEEEKSDTIICPSCNRKWNIKKYNACQCGAQIKYIMSNTNTVQSAEKFQKDYDIEQYDEGGYIGIYEKQVSKMLTDFAHLHLEAMRDEIKECFKDFLFYKYCIQEAANNYIKNNKL